MPHPSGSFAVQIASPGDLCAGAGTPHGTGGKPPILAWQRFTKPLLRHHPRYEAQSSQLLEKQVDIPRLEPNPQGLQLFIASVQIYSGQECAKAGIQEGRWHSRWMRGNEWWLENCCFPELHLALPTVPPTGPPLRYA